MVQNRERIKNVILFITDFCSLIISYYLSGYMWLTMYKKMNNSNTIDMLYGNLIVVCAAFTLTFILYSKYTDFMERGKYKEATSVIKTNAVMAAVIAVYQLLDKKGDDFPRGVYVLTIVINIVVMCVVHQIVKKYLVHTKLVKGSKMLVITTCDMAEKCIQEYDTRANWTRKVAGLAVIDKDMKGQSIKGVPVVANIHDVVTYMKNEIVDEVYICLSHHQADSMSELVMKLEDMGIVVHIKLDIMNNYKDFDASLGKIGKTPVITFANRFYDYKLLGIKRCMDILGAIVGLIIMFIAMIFVAPAIMIESPGPIFFKQKRVGRNGRYFYIYKFRSMYMDAEERKKELMAKNEMNGLVFKMKDDPRITKVGKFIRKTSIDELPQFINVLKGDMSLVGTRPPTVGEFKQYEGHHKRRLSMKPGITGNWQAYGRKTVTDFEDIVAMDLEYIDHWSIGLDIKILAATVLSVAGGSGQ